MITYSQIESNRFGINVFRSKTNELNIEKLEQELNDNNVDLLILRIPTTTKQQHHKLLNLKYKVLHADSLVYYKHKLIKDSNMVLENNKPFNGLIFKPINNENAVVLNKIIPIIFNNYQNHYYSNPYLDRKKINEGYIEWAKSYIDNSVDKIGWLVFDSISGEICAFATCSHEQENQLCEGILYGVMPNFSGKGTYSSLIKFTKEYFAQLGYSDMIVSTQLQNYAVQKVWHRENFVLFNSWETYHLIKH